MPAGYDALAPWYDLLHARLVEDIPLILAVADQIGGPILELGCGTGRLLLPLARAGRQVTGVDNSAEMLTIAQSKLALEPAAVSQRVALISADMTTLSLSPDSFALAIVGYNTIMHVPGARLPDLLGRLARCLHPGGHLLLDIANPLLIADLEETTAFEMEEALFDPVQGLTITPYARSRLDVTRQILFVDWLYEFSRPDQPAQSLRLNEAFHYLLPHEWDLQLTQAGFHLSALWGDYDRSPLTEESPRLLALAHT